MKSIVSEIKKRKKWKTIKIIFAITVILLFLGVVTIIGLGQIDKLSILWKTP